MSEVKTQNKIRVCDVKRAACYLEFIYLLDESKVEGYEFTSHGIYWNLIIGMPFLRPGAFIFMSICNTINLKWRTFLNRRVQMCVQHLMFKMTYCELCDTSSVSALFLHDVREV